MNKRWKDLGVILFLELFAVVASIFFSANFLSSTLLFFGLPSIYLMVRFNGPWKRLLSATFLFGVLYGFILDYLAEFNNAWSWAGTDQLVFSYKILGVVNIDVMIWFFLWVFYLVIFYEHFLEHDRTDSLSKNFWAGLLPAVLVIPLIVWSHYFKPELFSFGYAYFVLGVLTLPPFLYVAWRSPALLKKILKVSPFFIALYFTYELTALHLDQWRFMGEYVGIAHIGQIAIPFEELFVWIIISSAIVLAYYELYVDDLA